ncbi:MAG: outer membrane beta-barrel protein [Chromatiales bacterium]|jgi:opacity protein-like surface antigen|nr:outer membrane beta-barrel protein [Chromatiales bacterium]MDX9767818.1 outer membrane beta-barrel protein [Ectothiorhodospiraceae bacterium]
MRHTFTLAIAACLALAGATTAQAQNRYAPHASMADSWYFGIDAGVDLPAGTNVRNLDAGTEAEYEFGEGFAVLARAGRNFTDYLRIETELGYRSSDLDDIDGVATSGHRRTASMMLNAIYDIRIEPAIVPFVGAGIGIAQISDTAKIGGTTLLDDTDSGVMWQVMAGFVMPASETIDFNLTYRYVGGFDPTYRNEAGDRLESEFRTDSIVIGLARRFR